MVDEALTEKELGNQAYKKRDFNTAISHYKKAIELDACNMIFHSNLAAVYLEMKNYVQCIEECKIAVDVGRQNKAESKFIAKAYNRMGSAHKKSGNLEAAKTAIEKALKEHRNPEYNQNLCEVVAMIKRASVNTDVDHELANKVQQLGTERHVSFEVSDNYGQFQKPVLGQDSLEDESRSTFGYLLDLPQELICIVISKFELKDLRSLRLVCCQNRFLYSNLYHVVTTEIQKRGILNIDLYDVFEKDISRCIQFLKDFNYILTSTLKIKLVLPTYVMLCQVEHLKGKLLQLVDVCHARISDYYAYENVPISLLEIVLPKMTNLKKIYILGVRQRYLELCHNLINDNCESLEHLHCNKISLLDIQFNKMPSLVEIIIDECRGNQGVQSLFHQAASVKKVTICVPLSDRHLDVSTLINLCAPTVTSLDLSYMLLQSAITQPLANLRYLKLDYVKGEMSSLMTQAAPTLTTLILQEIDKNILVKNPFKSLKVLEMIGWNAYGDYVSDEIDISSSVLLSRPGRLAQFGRRIKGSCEDTTVHEFRG